MAKAGDFVYVDAKVFVASRAPTGVMVRCEVMEDSGPSQTYAVKAEGGGGTPLYVFNRELKEGER